jgi:hypothetical protein
MVVFRLAATAAKVSRTRVGTLRVVLDIVFSIADCIACSAIGEQEEVRGCVACLGILTRW